MTTPTTHIRNFCIIAHIDHGKSTLADRFLEITGALSAREMVEQYLDRMDLERERGITIKAHSVRLTYKARNGETYQLNLIDTPGHVDFSYEVSRSLKACEGALLVVDCTQGVEAQTVANAYQAADANLEIIPVLNKIDLASAQPERVRREIEDVIGIDASHALLVSAKEGTGVPEVLEEVVKRIPPPKGDPSKPLTALIFDSWFDSYQGAMVLVRVFDGVIEKGKRIRMMSSGRDFEVQEIGIFNPNRAVVERLGPGEVGYVVANIKDIKLARVGDTITDHTNPASAPLPGFQVIKPMVFAGLYPVESGDYENLSQALAKLALNDASLRYEPETSQALGFGFRCGFLGLLHMEIVQERLEREFELELITTAPTVKYRVTPRHGEPFEIENPLQLPPDALAVEEPIITATIHVPEEYLGAVLKLCEEKRGRQKDMRFTGTGRVILHYDLPLAEVVFDFHSLLKTVSRGYASYDYEFSGFQKADIVRLDILVNNEPVDALSLLLHKEQAYRRGRDLVGRIRKLIPRQLFEVAVQAAIGGRVIARETIKPLRKNVTAKCYGGDVTRKRKLLEKQKEGKKRMKQVGKVEIPQEAFLALLQVEKN